MPAVKETKIAYAKLAKNLSQDTTSDQKVVVNTIRMEIKTSQVKIYAVLREV